MSDYVHNTPRMVGQFFLTSAIKKAAPEEWFSDNVGSWFLKHDPELPVIRLFGLDKYQIGWILGYPINEKGQLLTQNDELCVTASGAESDIALENFIYSFGGRFAAVVIDSQVSRFYLDPCGSLSAVYCAHQGVVASTPNLISYDDKTPDRVHLARAIGIPFTNGMYPLGLTPRYGIDRILPNHFLDLSSWQLIRHWPKQPLVNLTSPDAAISEISVIVKRNIAAIACGGTARLTLTAGKDSRMLLACARDVADKLELLTAQIPDKNARIDCDIAAQIANRLGLRHCVLPTESANEEDLQEWMYRISLSTGEIRGWESATMFKRLPDGRRAILKGSVGELARGFYWYKDDTETAVIPPERLIEHCKTCPLYEEPLARARDWLRTVPVADSLQLLDMFYLEQRLGCWAGVVAYAECEFGFPVYPMCHRGVVERMLTLPTAYRRSGSLAEHIIAREWPELLEWPFNKAVGSRGLLDAVEGVIEKGRFALRDPGYALSRVYEVISQTPSWRRRRRSTIRARLTDEDDQVRWYSRLIR